MGERAVLVVPADADSVLGWYRALRATPLPQQEELVPGARSLLVRFARPAELSAVAGHVERLHAALQQRAEPTVDEHGTDGEVTLPVVYTGPDLAEVARLTGLTERRVVAAHTETVWRVAFSGFAPGFGYLIPVVGADRAALDVPRRRDPRPQVPAGSVGLADGYTGVYPSASPGGWRLIGRTDAALWDLRRDPPALLQPGMTVRFRAVRGSAVVPGAPERGAPEREAPEPAAPGPEGAATGIPGRVGPEQVAAPLKSVEGEAGGGDRAGTAQTPGARSITVIRPGLLSTVQDLGRIGFGHLGVSRSGVADRRAAVRANRAVGNPPDAAVLEIVLGSAEFEVNADLVVAVAGATIVAGAADRTDRPMVRRLTAGARFRLQRAGGGLRAYLAVSGGIAVPAVLGSRSTDTLSGLGPAPLRTGDVLPVGEPTDQPAAGKREIREPEIADPEPQPGRVAPAKDTGDPPAITLDVLPGPQRAYFADDVFAGDVLAGDTRVCDMPGSHTRNDPPIPEWTVSPQSNRVGIRLTGPRPVRRTDAEAPTQGLVRGAIQVPPSGDLVVFGPDHPVTGGYPVIGVLTEDSSDRLAQARPGATVRLRFVPR